MNWDFITPFNEWLDRRMGKPLADRVLAGFFIAMFAFLIGCNIYYHEVAPLLFNVIIALGIVAYYIAEKEDFL